MEVRVSTKIPSVLTEGSLSKTSYYLPGTLGKFGLGILGVFPAGLGTFPGTSSGMLGMPELAGGNCVVRPCLVAGLPIIGSIFELGDGEGFVGAVVGGGDPAGGVVPAGGVDSEDGIPVSGAVLAAGAVVFFLLELVTFGLAPLRIFLTVFFFLLMLVSTATVET